MMLVLEWQRQLKKFPEKKNGIKFPKKNLLISALFQEVPIKIIDCNQCFQLLIRPVLSGQYLAYLVWSRMCCVHAELGVLWSCFIGNTQAWDLSPSLPSFHFSCSLISKCHWVSSTHQAQVSQVWSGWQTQASLLWCGTESSSFWCWLCKLLLTPLTSSVSSQPFQNLGY